MTSSPRPLHGRSVVFAASRWTALAALIALLGVLIFVGKSATVAPLIGAVAALLALGLGAWAVLSVAASAPQAALPAALGMFTLQGAVLGTVLWIVRLRLGADLASVAGLAVIAVTVLWTTLFALFMMRARIPIYEFESASPTVEGQVTSLPAGKAGSNV